MGYRGRSVGRLMDIIDVISPARWANDSFIYGDGVIKYGEVAVAMVRWPSDPNDDRPLLSFANAGVMEGNWAEKCGFNWFCWRPYFDNRHDWINLLYIVQCVRNRLSFSDALHMIHLRNTFGKLDPSESDAQRYKDLIKPLIETHTYGRVEVTDEVWKHIALCAVHGVEYRRI